MTNSRTALKRPRPSTVVEVNRLDWEEVARVAYALYEQRGRANGDDLEDWLKAETIVRQRRSARAR